MDGNIVYTTTYTIINIFLLGHYLVFCRYYIAVSFFFFISTLLLFFDLSWASLYLQNLRTRTDKPFYYMPAFA